jgi:ligand-binding SRPBCC domain-containing protein
LSQSNTYSHSFSLRAPVEATFELFSDPTLLNNLTPSWFNLEPQAHELQTLAPGVEITYRLRWRGIPLRWRSRIVDWEPPYLELVPVFATGENHSGEKRSERRADSDLGH